MDSDLALHQIMPNSENAFSHLQNHYSELINKIDGMNLHSTKCGIRWSDSERCSLIGRMSIIKEFLQSNQFWDGCDVLNVIPIVCYL